MKILLDNEDFEMMPADLRENLLEYVNKNLILEKNLALEKNHCLQMAGLRLNKKP